MLVYKVNILEELKKIGYSTYRLQKKAPGDENVIMGSSQVHKLKSGEMIGINTLSTVCTLLNRQPGDLIGYIPDEQYDSLYESGYFVKNNIPALPRKKDE